MYKKVASVLLLLWAERFFWQKKIWLRGVVFGVMLIFLGFSWPVYACTLLPITGLNFGNYDPISGKKNDAVGSINVSCVASGPVYPTYTLSLSTGSSGSFKQRTMKQGANVLNYNLYQDANRTIIWGNGPPYPSKTAAYNINTVPVYGSIPASQKTVTPGSYSDSITVTLTYG